MSALSNCSSDILLVSRIKAIEAERNIPRGGTLGNVGSALFSLEYWPPLVARVGDEAKGAMPTEVERPMVLCLVLEVGAVDDN